MTRMADLKRKIQEAAERTQDPEMLLEAMRNGSDEDSTMLLAKLRTGHSVEDLARSIQDDSVEMLVPEDWYLRQVNSEV